MNNGSKKLEIRFATFFNNYRIMVKIVAGEISETESQGQT